MNIPITTPALLFPAIAILMLGYVNRSLGAATVIRNFRKDYDSGYIHPQLTEQIEFLSKRIRLFQMMLGLAATALLAACASMFLIYQDFNRAGSIAFGLSLIFMIFSLILSLYETSLSNKSLNIEIDDMLLREKRAKK